jgi:methionyl-tRNA formyltransferase
MYTCSDIFINIIYIYTSLIDIYFAYVCNVHMSLLPLHGGRSSSLPFIGEGAVPSPS